MKSWYFGNWMIDWSDWGLYRRDKTVDNCWGGLFALKCTLCHKWTRGCKDHKWCGLCEPCRIDMEQILREEDDMEQILREEDDHVPEVPTPPDVS